MCRKLMTAIYFVYVNIEHSVSLTLPERVARDIQKCSADSATKHQIQRKVFTTGPFDFSSDQVRDIKGHMIPNEGQPVDIEYYDDAMMNQSAWDISHMLRQAGVVDDAYAAYANLRPMAFKADLWRYMVLWANGGVYLDMSIQFKKNLSSWVPFETDLPELLVLVKDQPYRGYWNAMMASTRHNPAIEKIIKHVVGNIRNHYQPEDYWDTNREARCLSVTGPMALETVVNGPSFLSEHTVQRDTQYYDAVGNGRPYYDQTLGQNVLHDAYVFDPSNNLVAFKNRSLHLTTGALYYDLCDDHFLYCDQEGPPCGDLESAKKYEMKITLRNKDRLLSRPGSNRHHKPR